MARTSAVVSVESDVEKEKAADDRRARAAMLRETDSEIFLARASVDQDKDKPVVTMDDLFNKLNSRDNLREKEGKRRSLELQAFVADLHDAQIGKIRSVAKEVTQVKDDVKTLKDVVSNQGSRIEVVEEALKNLKTANCNTSSGSGNQG